MSTLAEIEAATNTLTPEQLRELLRFLAERVEATSQPFAETPAIAEWRPPAPAELGAILAPESEWTALCHRSATALRLMLAFDTNLAVYAAHSESPRQQAAAKFITSLARREDVVVCELMLVELYLKLRNEKIFSKPMTASLAATHCQGYRRNPRWRVIENAPVMESVWQIAAVDTFAFRRIIDARLATTLRHFGVTEFATANVKDFQGFGFERVWNPLDA